MAGDSANAAERLQGLAPLRVERQEGNRWRVWAAIPELQGRYLRVVTLEDRVTIHNAFPDRGVQAMKLNYYKDTDSLYIDLSENPSVESREISDGVQLDYDRAGNLWLADWSPDRKRIVFSSNRTGPWDRNLRPAWRIAVGGWR